MGAYLSKPVTEKISSDESSEFLSCGASSMQGWRIDQEDAHNTCLRYGKSRSLFAVYDGHGGSEVATYTASELPDFIKKLETYKNEQFSQALIDAFLEFDATLVEPDTQAILKQLAGAKDQEQEDSDYDGEEVDHLCREASMPLEEVMAKYSDDCTMHFQSPHIRPKKIGCSFSSAGCSSSFNESSEKEDLECNSLESSCSHLDESNCSKIDESCESSEEDMSLSKPSDKSCSHIEEATSSLCNGTSEKLNKEGESSKVVEKSDDSCNGSSAELDKKEQSSKLEEKPDSSKLNMQKLPKIEKVELEEKPDSSKLSIQKLSKTEKVEHASIKNREIISNNLNLKEISSKITNEEITSKLCSAHSSKQDEKEIVSKTDKEIVSKTDQEILSPEESKEELSAHSEKETKSDNISKTLNGDGGSPLVNGKIKDEGGGKIDCDEKMNEGEDSSSQTSEKMDVEVSNNTKNCKDLNGEMPQPLDTPTGKGKGGKAKGKGLINNALIHAMKVVKRQDKKRMAAVVAEQMYKQIRVSRDDSSSEDDEDEEDEEDENFESNLSCQNVEEEGSSDEEEGESDNEEEEDAEDDDEDADDDDEDDDDGENRGGVQYSEFPMNMREEPGYDSGCTACVAFLNGHELYVANVGDSRCVVCRNGKALDMSIDHKPEDEPEAARIFQAGGRITGDGRVNGGLNLSRALGDHSYKQNKTQRPEAQMISPLPDVRSLTLTPEDTFMVIACDGIWNSMSSQEAVDFINERLETHPKLSKIAEAMFDHCLSPDVHGDGTGCDNMTCIIIKFNSSWLSKSEGGKRSCDVTDPDTEVSDPQEKRCRVEAE